MQELPGTIAIPPDRVLGIFASCDGERLAIAFEDGHLTVPTGPGIGIRPNPDALRDFTVSTQTVKL